MNCRLIAAALCLAATVASQKTIRVPGDHSTIQAAINAASNRDTILVGPGTYAESINFNGKDIVVRSEVGPEKTTIRGDGNNPVVLFKSSEPRSAVLEGFTITGGSAMEGGGIGVFSAQPTIRGNHIVDNTCCAGGGIGVGFGSPLIEGNLIARNRGQVRCSGGIGGGGISVRGAGRTEIVGNTICDNYNIWGGGISLFAAGDPIVRNNIICRNRAGGGGAIYFANRSDTLVLQNLFSENTSSRRGGAIEYLSGASRFIQNTFARNTAPQGACLWSWSINNTHVFYNNIFMTDTGDAIVCDSTSTTDPTFRNNNVWSRNGKAYGGQCKSFTGVGGNISKDPRFHSEVASDYRIRRDSPCIDAGDDLAPSLPTTDLWGTARRLDGNRDNTTVVDIGANEFSGLRTFGDGCAGKGGFTPVIGARGGMPFAGNPIFDVTLANALGGAHAVLMVGLSNQRWGNLSLPLDMAFVLMPGCPLNISVDHCVHAHVSGSGPGNGTAVIRLAIPAAAQLRGQTVFVQWIVADPGPALVPGVVSGALQIDIL